jgi:hypothetical protein
MRRAFLLLVILFSLICIANISWWFYSASSHDSFEASKAAYRSVFPDVLKGSYTMSLLQILLSGFSAGYSLYIVDKRKKLPLFIPLLIINGIIFNWTLWTLM